MGKGDKKTRRGKIIMKSTGITRPRKKGRVITATANEPEETTKKKSTGKPVPVAVKENVELSKPEELLVEEKTLSEVVEKSEKSAVKKPVAKKPAAKKPAAKKPAAKKKPTDAAEKKPADKTE